ncbi:MULTISPECIES: nucleic acid-binding protein [Microcystis]|uniref:nucleic acid-binding protein n=1 Tax=Microcystis TaxID=1125 RepID=UPI001F552275|nr:MULTISPECIES: nucleic acid-binding protein [Microcystis]UZO76068.1 nucleic acid-binding protein [Microcystis aeruginosa str. Chao 1910]
MILCDAGVLLCLVDRTQPQHKAYRNTVMRLAKPLVTTWSCLTEAMYLALHRGGWQMQKQLGQLLLVGLRQKTNREKPQPQSLLGIYFEKPKIAETQIDQGKS